MTFAHVLTYLPNPHALSIKMAGQQDIKTLEYAQVVKIPESEGLFGAAMLSQIRGIWINIMGGEYFDVRLGIP